MNMCKNIKIRILAFMMAFWLAFSVSYNDYQEVKALEWAIPVIELDTAIKFLLGLLGVSVAEKVTSDWWDNFYHECYDYTIDDPSLSSDAIVEWWDNVRRGVLDQSSKVWTKFKEFLQSKFNSFTGSTSVSSVMDYFGANVSYSDLGLSSDVTFTDGFYFVRSDNTVTCYLFNNSTATFNKYSDAFGSSRSMDLKYGANASLLIFNLSATLGLDSHSYFDNLIENGSGSFSFGFSVQSMFLFGLNYINNSNAVINAWDVSSVDSFPLISANPHIEDTDLTEKDTTTDRIPGALPLPWDLVGDDAPAIDDTISQAQDAVAEGEMDLADYWAMVLDLVNALAIDDTADPPISLPDETPFPDIVAENTSNGDFTLKGLEKVFPFCIPWDIKDFVTLLVARPIAPKITYPFYNPVTKQNINIEIDFAKWNTVVVLFRYILDFLLIIGLLLLARSLVGAGGDD